MTVKHLEQERVEVEQSIDEKLLTNYQGGADNEAENSQGNTSNEAGLLTGADQEIDKNLLADGHNIEV